ncbi:hypothetical protein ACFFX0_22445 [Citricoccus parietis]|uniref:Uncharacterized protein n=1 Tax=Citricoccus parietis TaxID=592307 RepID=A0ABV5G4E6_9MICC
MNPCVSVLFGVRAASQAGSRPFPAADTPDRSRPGQTAGTIAEQSSPPRGPPSRGSSCDNTRSSHSFLASNNGTGVSLCETNASIREQAHTNSRL